MNTEEVPKLDKGRRKCVLVRIRSAITEASITNNLLQALAYVVVGEMMWMHESIY